MRIVAATLPLHEHLMGCDGRLPWPRIRADMRHFVHKTRGRAVIMGRATWESIGQPLRHRLNIVVSTTLAREALPAEVHLARSLPEATAIARAAHKPIAIIGGARLYAKALEDPRCRRVHLTLLQPPEAWVAPEAANSVHFPFKQLTKHGWRLASKPCEGAGTRGHCSLDAESGWHCRFATWERVE